MITTVKPGVGFESQTICSAGLEPVDQVLSASDGSEQDNLQKVASFIEAIAPQKFDDAVLAGFRIGHREHATAIAEKTLAAGASATETILQIAGWIQDMKARLSRKEFGAFVKDLLQWVGDEARKYLDIARAFDGFDLSRLLALEPFTLLKLRSKSYAPVLAALSKQPVITPSVVQDLIRLVLPKQPRKKTVCDISGWKRNRSGGGRHYEVLLHDETTGLSIEQQAQAEGILPQKVIAEAIALRAKHKEATLVTQVTEVVAHLSREPDDVQEHSQSHTEELAVTKIAFLETQLSLDDAIAIPVASESVDMDQAIAIPVASESVDEVVVQEREVDQHPEQQAEAIAVPPEAILAGENRSEVEWVLNAPINELEAVISSVPVRSAYRALYLLNQFQSSDAQRMELLEHRVTEYHIAIGALKPTAASPKVLPPWGIAAQQITEDSPETVEAIDYPEPEQESEYLEPGGEDAQNLEPGSQAIVGDQESASNQAMAQMWKSWASDLGLVLDYITVGEYTVRHKYRKLGTVVQKYDINNNSWWENRRQVSLLGVDDGDLMRYKTLEEAAIALGKLCEVIDLGDRASSGFFGDRWEAFEQHLVEEHANFINDVNQEVRS